MRIILTGASGRMGKQMLALFQSTKDVEIFAVDKAYEYDQKNDTPSCVSAKYARIADVKECADVIVDFSLHTAVPEVVDFAVRNRIPLVVATTGHTEKERACVARASESIPVFAASNMSIAIAYLKDFSAKLAAVFESADIEILEAHHSKKVGFSERNGAVYRKAYRQAKRIRQNRYRQRQRTREGRDKRALFATWRIAR